MLAVLLHAGLLAVPVLARPSPDWVDRFPALKTARAYNSNSGPPGPSTQVGDVTGFHGDGSDFTIECGASAVRVQFWRRDIVRIWLAWDGVFEDPATADLVVASPRAVTVSSSSEDEYHEMKAEGTDGVSLRAYKRPLRFAMYANDGRMLWEEATPISFNTTDTYQNLTQGPIEHFFGGGMQNGRFSHRGTRIRISQDTNWDEGGNPNSAPMYMSSAGYGVFRNTWAPGFYDFRGPSTVLGHNESRFDAFYFASAEGSFKALLEGYTFLTGRPFMPPIYALGLGDSDCYHDKRHGMDTQVVLAEIDGYDKYDIPGSWNLPNDGYGCGFGAGNATFPTDYSILDSVVSQMTSKGFVTGLWSSTGLPRLDRDVSEGIRVFKTDVAWIGEGYKYAFDSVKSIVSGVKDNSDARPFIWTVEGWAGTHRMAVMWTGDDSGNFDYIRWQIPTYAGTGFAAMAHVSGDIDGIFGGSPETYTRDLQFKCLMTVMMTMSGWSQYHPDKQPWTYGEPYTSINRIYLNLKMRLVPYFYTLSREAYDTGTPPIRAMAMEFPEDASLYESHEGSAQQFMAGPSILVAPVYKPLDETVVRDGIYLPAGKWIDYWSGDISTGPLTIDGYHAPLEILPMFIRAGAIIPTWPVMGRPAQKPADPLTLDVYPWEESSFSLYEDDGVTRRALEEDAFSKTPISCSAAPYALVAGGLVRVTVGSAAGDFEGKLQRRAYEVRLHVGKGPTTVSLKDESEEIELPQFESPTALDAAETGWFYDSEFGGIARVKTLKMATSSAFTITFQGGTFEGPRAHHLRRHQDSWPRVRAMIRVMLERRNSTSTLRGAGSSFLRTRDGGRQALRSVP